MKNKEPAPPQQKVTGADLAQVTFWAGTPAGPAVEAFVLFVFLLGRLKRKLGALFLIAFLLCN